VAAACGDTTCNGAETCSTCAQDCGACAPRCGDGTCNGTETCSTCAEDCGPCCGAPTASQFSIVVRRTLIAPYDFDNQAWDWDGNISDWYDQYGLFVEVAATIASDGTYEWGTIGKAVTLWEMYAESLFSEFVAPDPLVELYFLSSGSSWQHIGGWYELPMDTHLIGALNVGTYVLGPESWVLLQFFDNDLVFNDRVGDIYIDRATARVLADCGVMKWILSPNDMNMFDTRIEAIEIEIASVR